MVGVGTGVMVGGGGLFDVGGGVGMTDCSAVCSGTAGTSVAAGISVALRASAADAVSGVGAVVAAGMGVWTAGVSCWGTSVDEQARVTMVVEARLIGGFIRIILWHFNLIRLC